MTGSKKVLRKDGDVLKGQRAHVESRIGPWEGKWTLVRKVLNFKEAYRVVISIVSMLIISLIIVLWLCKMLQQRKLSEGERELCVQFLQLLGLKVFQNIVRKKQKLY